MSIHQPAQDALQHPSRLLWPGALALLAGLVLALAPAWAAAQEDDAVIASEHAELGTILTTSAGMTLYTFAEDDINVSACVDEACLALWTPLTAEAGVALSVDPALGVTVDTFERPDTGELQVTIDGHPVYLFTDDLEPGDALGHGFEDSWFAIQVETEVEAEGEFSVTPTPGGLTITTYTGTLAAFEADGAAQGLVSAFATVEGEFVGYVFGAPAFVNAEFTATFAAGLDAQGMIVRAN